MQNSRSKIWWKLIGALALCCAAFLFVYAQYESMQPPEQPRESARPDAGPPGEGQRERPFGEDRGERRQWSEEDRTRMRQQIATDLGLSAEQQKQVEALDKELGEERGPESWQQRREAMEEILTPEQQEKMHETFRERGEQMGQRMRARMEERAKLLPEGEREVFLKKFEERTQERRQRWQQRSADGENASNQPSGPPPEGGAPPQ